MFACAQVWNSALLESGSDVFAIAQAIELKLFSSRGLKTAVDAVHTQADPFLLVDQGWLYVFLEVQRVARPGRIEAYRTRDLMSFEHLGVILEAPYHLSYPHVFRSGSDVFMVPESEEAGEVALYRFGAFPGKLRKERVLLSGRYSDPTLFFHGGRWWLFATGDGLELFHASSLHGPFVPHNASPITRDPHFRRCGGPIISDAASVFRPAQDCFKVYGDNLNIMRIDELNTETYSESVARTAIFDRTRPWRSRGAHHLSVVDFRGRTILAADGKQNDLWINRPLSQLRKLKR